MAAEKCTAEEMAYWFPPADGAETSSASPLERYSDFKFTTEMSTFEDFLSTGSPLPLVATIATTAQPLEGPPQEFPVYLRLSATAVCMIILSIGTVGNVLVPVVVCKTKELRNSTNLFLINLGIADLLVLVVCVPTVLIELHSKPETWDLGPFMCKVVPFTEYSVAHASILTMLAISLERYYAICKPLKAGYKCTHKRAAAMIVIIWILSFLATGPVLIFTEQSNTCYVDATRVKICNTAAYGDWQRAYFFFSMTLLFWFPLIVLLVIYFLITKRLIMDSKLDPDLVQHSEAAQSRAKRQVVCMLAAVVVCFFLCLLPFRLFTTWLLIVPEDSIQNLGMESYYSILYACRILLYLNSAVNPILYNVISSKFRQGFVTVLCCEDVATRRRRALLRQSTFNTTSSSMAISLKSGGIAQARMTTLTGLGPEFSKTDTCQQNGYSGMGGSLDGGSDSPVSSRNSKQRDSSGLKPLVAMHHFNAKHRIDSQEVQDACLQQPADKLEYHQNGISPSSTLNSSTSSKCGGGADGGGPGMTKRNWLLQVMSGVSACASPGKLASASSTHLPLSQLSGQKSSGSGTVSTTAAAAMSHHQDLIISHQQRSAVKSKSDNKIHLHEPLRSTAATAKPESHL